MYGTNSLILMVTEAGKKAKSCEPSRRFPESYRSMESLPVALNRLALYCLPHGRFPCQATHPF